MATQGGIRSGDDGLAVAVVLGELAGERVLRKIPQKPFRRVVSIVLLAVAVHLLATHPH